MFFNLSNKLKILTELKNQFLDCINDFMYQNGIVCLKLNTFIPTIPNFDTFWTLFA